MGRSRDHSWQRLPNPQSLFFIMDRQAFLARVREAAHQGSMHRVRTRELPADAGYVGGGEDLPARLAAEVEAVGGRAHLVSDAHAARRALDQLLEERQPRSALCWEHPLLDRLGVTELLSARGIPSLSYRQLATLGENEQRTALLAAELGIASADYAVAETGTLAIASGPGRERCVTLLPPVLVQIVDSTQVIPDLFDLFRATDPAALASNFTLITGPSKTGDIELQLTTGVHGPGDWQVIVIRQT
jgi:L-lactate utilization protein LutC